MKAEVLGRAVPPASACTTRTTNLWDGSVEPKKRYVLEKTSATHSVSNTFCVAAVGIR